MASVMKGISICARCAEVYRNERLAAYQLTGNHYTYILQICRNPGISQEQLAVMTCINKSNVARQLVYLEQNGFVRREGSERDKRVTLLYPTQRAKEVFPVIRRVLQEWNTYITGDFTEEERNLLAGMIEKITDKSTAYLRRGKENG